MVENFVETVEATLPREATIVKTIGDEVMVVSPDAAALTEWAVAFLGRFDRRPQPRVGIHSGDAVYRDGDYFGSSVNLAHRIVNRALAGEVLVTDRVAAALGGRPGLRLEPIGEVTLRGFPAPTELFVVRAAEGELRAAGAGRGGRAVAAAARRPALRRARLGLHARPRGARSRRRGGHRAPRRLRPASGVPRRRRLLRLLM